MSERRDPAAANPFAVLIPTAPATPPTPDVAGLAPVGVLVLPDGARVPIAGPLVIGRNPRSDDPTVRLVVLEPAGPEVSRTHARLSPGDHGLVLDDLGSRNGTGLTPPGQPRRRVAPGTSAPVPIGSVLHFAAGLDVTVAPSSPDT